MAAKSHAEVEPSSGPSCPVLQDHPTIETVEEECFSGDVFCTAAPDCNEEPKSANDEKECESTDFTSSSAKVACELLWVGMDVLKVSMDKIPDKWRYQGKPIEPTHIIGWANEAWGTHDAIPEFQHTCRESDIRISFSEKDGCWSVVGSGAMKISGATMNLNLSKPKGTGRDHNDKRIKSLVIHEFGHALGLEHEHQRSDFWEGVHEYLDLKRMGDDRRVEKSVKKVAKGIQAASCGADWFKEKEAHTSEKRVSDYDPHSIMHYGFDKDWIKEKNFRDERTLPKDLKGRKYIVGILRTTSNLAEGPSEIDIKTLQDAYIECKHRGCTSC